MRYRNRREAGRRLGEAVAELALDRPVVLALPRGGLPVGFEVAKALGCRLDVVVARKLGVPWHEELGMGAIAEEGVMVVNEDVRRRAGVTADQLEHVRRREEAELTRRVERYRGGRPPEAVAGAAAVVVDDGLATGYTARAAIESARRRGAAKVVLAVPVGSPDTVDQLAGVADEVVCPFRPLDLVAVGQWYEDFRQTSDQEVVELLAAALPPPPGSARGNSRNP